jgi:hypothetical protein
MQKAHHGNHQSALSGKARSNYRLIRMNRRTDETTATHGQINAGKAMKPKSVRIQRNTKIKKQTELIQSTKKVHL